MKSKRPIKYKVCPECGDKMYFECLDFGYFAWVCTNCCHEEEEYDSDS